MENLVDRYKNYIYNRSQDLIKSGKKSKDFNNFDLAKIFEYYSCIKLTDEFSRPFYEYSDIDPTYKEEHKLSKYDTGIDASDLKDTIVQCKLRDKTLNWKECSTFFGSQNIYCEKENKTIVKWKNLIITRNKDSTLSDNLKERKKLFLDRTYDKAELLKYCEELEKPKIKIVKEKVEIRDYQKEAINLIRKMKSNLIINLPTGTGKNFIIAHSLKPNKFSYLILVPRIILLEQIESELLKYNPDYEEYIQKIGDGNNKYNSDKNITICVYNSVLIIDKHIDDFDYIFVDEAHHISVPEIYKIDNDDYYSDYSDDDSDYSDNESNSESNSELEDESEEEEDVESVDNKTYIKIIKSYQKYNNNIYLSATIDKLDGFEYYTKDIRDMIDKNYLCDYQITIPIFTEDPSNKNICEYLIKNYRNVIIYCNSQKEGILINKLMNSIQKNSSEYIDCNTTKSERNKIIKKYKSGELPFLVNVRILVEGFDAPITKGICFMHLPSSKTTLIQIIGRALRLHSDKKMANIILPFSGKEDESSINNFLKTMARNDSRIKQSYCDKKVGGYIDIVNEIEDLEMENEIELKYELIFDKMGILKNCEEIWEKKLEEVKEYIDENGCRPSVYDKDKDIKSMGWWIGTQQKSYKEEQFIMKDTSIRKKWEEFIDEYKKHFISYEKKWETNLEKVIEYIKKYNKRPNTTDKNNDIKTLGKWIGTQQKSYKEEQYIMKNDIIRKKWEDFIDEYKKHFISYEKKWETTLEKVIEYIKINNKRPSSEDKNNDIKILGVWVLNQQNNYIHKKNIMKNLNIQKKWSQFINDDKYKDYFQSNEEIWINKLEKVKEYINRNNRKPQPTDKDEVINNIGYWLSFQQKNYINKIQIMKIKMIRKRWEEFVSDDKYKKYFLSNEEELNNKLKECKEYINKYNKRPSQKDKNNDIKQLGHWLSSQIRKNKENKGCMIDETIRKKWEEFINDDKYKNYFLTNEKKWNNNLEKCKEYIDRYNKRPLQKDKNTISKGIGYWISDQIINYKNNQGNMKDENIRKKWERFINDDKYKKYFE
jgi:superfamily II DNA or RNA helicase/CHASE3 domain sensor protein